MEDRTYIDCCNMNPSLKSPEEPESAVADFAAPMETPDLRNWFSSYVYQSPELTPSYSCEDSFPIKEPTKDIELYVEDSESEHSGTDAAVVKSNYPSMFVKNISGDGCSLHESLDELDHQHKVPENSDSFPSQPPDIRNWFSSYVYDSPKLDTDEIGCSLPTTIESVGLNTEDDFTQKEATWTSVDPIADNSIHTDVVKRRKLFGLDKSEIGSAKLYEEFSAQENVGEDHRSHMPPEAKKDNSKKEKTEIYDANPTDGLINPRLKDNSKKEKIEREEVERGGPVLGYKNSATSNEESIIDSEKDPGWVLPNPRSKQRSLRRKMSANANRKRHESAENGVLKEVEKGLMTSRKPLMEISNVCSSGSEVAGKWRCPQKTKPCVGPPLKQLRLGKWIHRV